VYIDHNETDQHPKIILQTPLTKKEKTMRKYIYRGVVVDTPEQRSTLAQQMRRPALVYRGIKHDGERTLDPTPNTQNAFYRGAQYA
jgi:hypothetical protein